MSPLKGNWHLSLAYETTWRCQKNPFIGALGWWQPSSSSCWRQLPTNEFSFPRLVVFCLLLSSSRQARAVTSTSYFQGWWCTKGKGKVNHWASLRLSLTFPDLSFRPRALQHANFHFVLSKCSMSWLWRAFGQQGRTHWQLHMEKPRYRSWCCSSSVFNSTSFESCILHVLAFGWLLVVGQKKRPTNPSKGKRRTERQRRPKDMKGKHTNNFKETKRYSHNRT